MKKVNLRKTPPFSLPCYNQKSILLLCFIIFNGLGCVGSGTAFVPYDVEDDGVFAPSLRFVAGGSRGAQQEGSDDAESGEDVHADRLTTFEIGVSGMTGKNQGSFDGSIQIDETIFAPNTELEGRFQLNELSAYFTSGFRNEAGLEISGLLGVQLTTLKIEVDGGGVSASTKESGVGLLGGLRLRWLITEDFRLYAMARGSSLNYSFEQNEIGVEYRVTHPIALFAGWRRSDYDLDFSNRSDLDLTWKGFFAGVQFEY